MLLRTYSSIPGRLGKCLATDLSPEYYYDVALSSSQQIPSGETGCHYLVLSQTNIAEISEYEHSYESRNVAQL